MINVEITSTRSIVTYSFFLARTSLTPRNIFVLNNLLALRRKYFAPADFSWAVPKRMASVGDIFRKRLSTPLTFATIARNTSSTPMLPNSKAAKELLLSPIYSRIFSRSMPLNTNERANPSIQPAAAIAAYFAR
ncbi:hypothetical protein D3C81_1657680 [compost metagenome]